MKWIVSVGILFFSLSSPAADPCVCKVFDIEIKYQCQDQYDCKQKCFKKIPEGKSRSDCDVACSSCAGDSAMPEVNTRNSETPKPTEKKTK
jgi:hypothetical protein